MTQEIVGKSQGELSSSDRTVEPVKDEEKRVMRNHDRTGKLVEGSSTLRWMTETSISTSPVCQMRW